MNETCGAQGSSSGAELVSIITVCYNSAATIRTTINSVLSQTYPDIEYIIIDGGSTDSTLEIIREYGGRISRLVSESDRGIYDAMNKGVRLANGGIVGLLNADDFYIDNDVIKDLMCTLREAASDCVFADVEYVDKEDINKVVRYYDSSYWDVSKFRYGWIPAHPAFFIRRHWYLKCGFYSLHYQIAADFEWLVRVLHAGKASYSYLQRPVVRMRLGGVSTSSWRHRWILNREIVRACRQHGIWTALPLVLLKVPRKLCELTAVRGKVEIIANIWHRARGWRVAARRWR